MAVDLSRQPILTTLYQQLRYRPRILISILVGVVVYLAAPKDWTVATRSLVAWDVATFLYLAMFFRLVQRSDPEKIRARAKLQDDGAVATLTLSLAAAVMCFVAIAFELAGIKGMEGADRSWHLVIVACTIPTAWLFIHSMFALHYAHEYYDAKDGKGHGLEFPGHIRPAYSDFIYFSFIIGTSGQTADVAISGSTMRRLATIHCTFSFFFNIVTIGLTVNVASSLL